MLLIGTFILIVYVRNLKDKALAKYPKVDCSDAIYRNITEQQVIDEFNAIDTESNSDTSKADSSGAGTKGYVQCYCKPKIQKIIT